MTLTRTRYLPMPKRLKREKMGVQQPQHRTWLRHRRWVKSHGCCVPGCPALEVEFAHLRKTERAGMGQKPHDQHGVPLCHNHHREQHDCGQGSFEDRHHIDLDAIAAEFVRTSPDYRMRVALLIEATLAADREKAIPIYRFEKR